MYSAQQRADIPSVNASANQGKRLTRVERARLEAMAAFGNCDFDSLKTRKVDFQSKLVITSSSPTVCSEKHLTRIQLAKLEANEAFKNIKLGVDNTRPAKRKNKESQATERVPKVRKLTRLEQARLDANKAFHNLSLARPGTKTKAESGKENVKEKQQKRVASAPKITKSVTSKVVEEQQQCIEKTPVGPTGSVEITDTRHVAVGTSPVMTKSVSVDFGTTTDSATAITSSTAPVTNKLTAVDSAKVMDSNTAVTASTRTMADSSKSHMSTTGTPTAATATDTATSPAALTPQVRKRFSTCKAGCGEEAAASESITEATVTQSRPNEVAGEVVVSTELCSVPQRLTRVQRARLEALKSFGGQGLDDVYKTSTRKLAKYLTPKKSRATNTKRAETANTPCQTDALRPCGDVTVTRDGAASDGKTQIWLQNINKNLNGSGRHPKPKTCLYSSINANESFDSVTSLLETSRRVVQTAKLLETPP